MERIGIIANFKTWNPEIGRYESGSTHDFSQNPKMEFGSLEITTQGTNLSRDPLDSTSAVLLSWKEGKPRLPVYVYEQRSFKKTPFVKVAGVDIMKKSPTWFASDLKSLVYLHLFADDPQRGHPDLVEITPVTKIGEGGSSLLL